MTVAIFNMNDHLLKEEIWHKQQDNFMRLYDEYGLSRKVPCALIEHYERSILVVATPLVHALMGNLITDCIYDANADFKQLADKYVENYAMYKYCPHRFHPCLSRVWAKGVIALKPSTIPFLQWIPNFSPANQTNTNAQVWVCFWGLRLEFWEPRTLLEIASAIGVPVRIDPNTIQCRYGLFARILVDVNLSGDLPADIVIKRNNGESFVQAVDYEKFPDLCSHCGNVGHCVRNCKFVKPAPSKSDVPTNGRGRSRQRRPKQRRKSAASQVYVPKQREGKGILVDSSPSTRIDYGEGPSFAQTSPIQVQEGVERDKTVEDQNVLSENIVVQEDAQIVVFRQDEAENGVFEICVSANEQHVVHESVPAKGVGSPTPLSSWYDETEHEEVGGDFTLVQSKSQKKLMKRQAALASNREAYLRRSKDISK
ncbi:hypothetical protein ACLB2K_012165 [Fragaria x ananassa]